MLKFSLLTMALLIIGLVAIYLPIPIVATASDSLKNWQEIPPFAGQQIEESVELAVGAEATDAHISVGMPEAARQIPATFEEARLQDLEIDKLRTRIELRKNSVVVERGFRVEVSVRRSGGSMGVMKLGLIPAAGTNLMATGGEFKSGQVESSITIEAPKNARSGIVVIVADETSQPLSVSVTF